MDSDPAVAKASESLPDAIGDSMESKANAVDKTEMVDVGMSAKEAELNKKDSMIIEMQAQLDRRELDLLQKEQDLNKKVKDQTSQSASVSRDNSTVASYDASRSYTREVQFIAISRNKDFSHLDHLGEIVTERIPGRNLIRYKLKGQWTDAQVNTLKIVLAQEGYPGAFESL